MKSFVQPGVAAPLQVLRVLALSLMTVSTGMIGPAKALRGGYGGEREKVMFAQVQANLPPSCYNGNSGNVVFMLYWIPQEGTNDVNDDGTVIFLSGPNLKNLVDDSGKTIEKTDENTFAKCAEEGTCKLLNGDIINLSDNGTGQAPTFIVLNKTKSPYGLGAFGNALVPFVSVAANDLPRGTLLFVQELNGFKLPNNKVHNGCVRVDDRAEDISCHIYWMISMYPTEVNINPRLPDKAHVKVS